MPVVMRAITGRKLSLALALVLGLAAGSAWPQIFGGDDEARRAIVRLKLDLEGLRQKYESDLLPARERADKASQDLNVAVNGLNKRMTATERELESCHHFLPVCQRPC